MTYYIVSYNMRDNNFFNHFYRRKRMAEKIITLQFTQEELTALKELFTLGAVQLILSDKDRLLVNTIANKINEGLGVTS